MKNIHLFSLLLTIFNSDLISASLTLHISDEQAQVVDFAVVELTPKNHQPATLINKATIDQIDKEYVPRVIVVQKNGSVRFPNNDDIKHHVYSFSPAKQFELPLYKGTPANPVNFEMAGIITLGCNIHDWMRGYIYVSETPYVGISNSDGTIVIENLPADHYRIEIWHPQINDKIELENLPINKDDHITRSVTLELKPLIKIRRNQGNRRRGYN